MRGTHWDTTRPRELTDLPGPFASVHFDESPDYEDAAKQLSLQVKESNRRWSPRAVEIPYYQILRVESVEQELDGNRLSSKVTTRVLPLSPLGDDTVSATVERMATLA